MEKTNEKPTYLYDFIVLFPVMTEESKVKCLEKLNSAEKPKYFLGKDVPEDLNMITFGEYSDLCDAIGMKDHIDALKEIVRVLNPESTEDDLNYEYAYDAWGYANWVIKEIGRINEVFSSIKVEYTDQEKKAGIDQIQFGTFGILDWYARRMGIADQNLVNSEKWVRIYQCMKNDAEETAYNRRLQKVYEQESKHHH